MPTEANTYCIESNGPVFLQIPDAHIEYDVVHHWY